VEEFTVGTIVLATGFRDFDPARIPGLNYGKLDNVLTALEFERLVNASGPTAGKVLLKNGQPPRSVVQILGELEGGSTPRGPTLRT
jgi:heterodisulfide reductase subunit A